MKIVEIFTEQNNPTFYSTLTRAVQAIPQPKAPGMQWANMLVNLTNKGVKQSEIEWSGVMDWLQQNPGVITKDQVLQYIQSHEVQVHDTTHGVARDTIKPDERAGVEHGPAWDQLVQQIQALQAKYDKVRRSGDPRIVTPDDKYKELEAINAQIEPLRQQQDALHAQMIDDSMKRQGLSGEPSSYADYKLPGGKDYRELMLTMPVKQHQIQIGQPQPPGGEHGNKEFAARYNGGELVQGVTEYPFQIGDQKGSVTYWPVIPSRFENPEPKFIVNATFMQNARFDTLEDAVNEITQRYNNSNPKSGYLSRKDVYKSPHWREPNILAHVRFDTRTNQEGQKVLHVAEVQSDWHQQGRKRGYQQGLIQPNEIEIERVAPDVGVDPMTYKDFVAYRQKNNISLDAPVVRHRLRGSNSAWYVFYNPNVTDQDIITFVQDDTDPHTQYGMRNKKGTEGVPNAPFKKEWPQLAMKRMLRYAAENGYDKLTWDMGETSNKRYDLSKRVGRIEYDSKPGKLTVWGLSGKGQPIMVRDGTPPENLDDYIGKDLANKLINDPTDIIQNSDYFGPTHVLSGSDMKIGGEGMKGFYDQILPTLMNKYGKKWGVRVAPTKIDASTNIMKEPSDPDAYVMPNKRPKKRLVPAWGIDITPEMRDSIMQGQPLWEQFIKRTNFR